MKKIKDPYVAFFLALFGAASIIIPDPLKLPSVWVVGIILLKVIPWSVNNATQGHIRKLSKQAEYATLSFLLVIWSIGIIGSAALIEYSPPLLEKASIDSYSKLAQLDKNKKPIVYRTAAATEKPHLNMIVRPQAEEARHLPTIEVIKDAIDDLIAPVSKYSIIFFVAVVVIYLILMFLMSVVTQIATTNPKEE